MMRLDDYASEPRASRHDVVPMIGMRDIFRLRVGDWRVIFRVEGETMMVTRVAHRREVYR